MTLRSLCAVLVLISWMPSSGCASGPDSVTERPAALEEPIHVLILGDSISIGYTQHVRRMLGEQAVVVRPTASDGERPENCAGTNHGITGIERWLALDGGDWDVIHFNFGLHDLKRVDAETGKNSDDPSDPHQAPPERYRDQLRQILDTLEATGSRLVYATTTPVPEGDLRPYREPEDAVLYNNIAREVMVEAGIPIDDLYAFALPRLGEIQQPENVHFTNAGSELLAQEVVAAIRAVAGIETNSQ